MKKRMSFLLIIIIAITSLLSGCKKDLTSYKKTYFYFDTIISLSIWHDDKVDDTTWDEVEQILKDIDLSFNRNNTNSELHKINESAGVEPVQVSDMFMEVLDESLNFSDKTNGKFDPTIGAMIDFWGEYEDPNIPTNEEIEDLKTLVDYRDIQIDHDENTVFLPKEGMILDLGAIAKGYATDVVGEYLTNNDIEHAIINMGGNILTVGTRYKANFKDTNDWVIGIKNPDYNNNDAMLDPTYSITQTVGDVFIVSQSVVTSGIYERYWVGPDGTKYPHILDPDTGKPVDNNISSVSIITPNSMIADGLSTAIFCLGPVEGMKVVEELDDVEAIFITKDHQLIKSSGVDDKLQFEANDQYKN